MGGEAPAGTAQRTVPTDGDAPAGVVKTKLDYFWRRKVRSEERGARGEDGGSRIEDGQSQAVGGRKSESKTTETL